jgi:uncharacterized membrane protein
MKSVKKISRKVSHWDFHPHVRSGDDRTLGERSADWMRHGMGSWPFVLGFVITMSVWIAYNAVSTNAFDPFPFILLNLALSTLAGLQGAILLIAAKRADRIDAELAKYHLEVSESIKEMLQEHKKMLEELKELSTK